MNTNKIGDDIIDLRDLEDEELEAITEAIEDTGYSFNQVLEDEPTLINRRYFKDYAQELAEDTGAINKDAKWPLNCIDWDQATEELETDYVSFEVDGEEYLFRAF